jgi:hypothetical protein
MAARTARPTRSPSFAAFARNVRQGGPLKSQSAWRHRGERPPGAARSMPTPLPLSDEEMDVLLGLAAPIAYGRRREFMEAVAAAVEQAGARCSVATLSPPRPARARRSRRQIARDLYRLRPVGKFRFARRRGRRYTPCLFPGRSPAAQRLGTIRRLDDWRAVRNSQQDGRCDLRPRHLQFETWN